MCFSPQRREISRHRNFKKCSETASFWTFWPVKVLLATAFNFSTSELQKGLRAWAPVLKKITSKCASCHSGVQFLRIRTSQSAPSMGSFYILISKFLKFCSEHEIFCAFWLQKVLRHRQFHILASKRAFRYSGVQVFGIRTSKSAPSMRCDVHFDMKRCFSLQRRASFRHQNFKKSSEHAVFCLFWFQNELFATAECNFWFLCLAPTSAAAALSAGLFDPRIIEKTQHFATSLTFGADVSSLFWLSLYCILFLLTWLLYWCIFFLLTFTLLHFLSSDLTTLLCFSTVHIVGSWTSKLPSIICHFVQPT